MVVQEAGEDRGTEEEDTMEVCVCREEDGVREEDVHVFTHTHTHCLTKEEGTGCYPNQYRRLP